MGPMLIGLAATSSDSASGFYILGGAVLLAAVLVFALHKASSASGLNSESDSRPTKAVAVTDRGRA